MNGGKINLIIYVRSQRKVCAKGKDFATVIIRQKNEYYEISSPPFPSLFLSPDNSVKTLPFCRWKDKTMNVWPHIACTGRKIGYARVSTRDQKLRMQKEALTAVSCDQIFEDHGISGALDKRPGLDAMMKILEPGDTVVVFKLDRLGRSVLHLSDLLVRFRNDGIHFCSLCEAINTTTPGGKLVYHLFSAFAEFQRDIIIENTLHGIEAARRKGKHLGRPRKLDEEAIIEGHRLLTQQQVPMKDIASRLGVSHSTLARSFKRMELALG